MQFIAIIQARMNSTRFPQKMMIQISGKYLIDRVIERVNSAKLIDKTVLATSLNKEDTVLVRRAEGLGISVFRGSGVDVLDRFYCCAKKFNAKNIVRITGDCPLIDPMIIDEVIALFKKNKLDYASNVLPPTFPDGLDVEVFSFNALAKAWKEATLKSEREHVTPYIWKNEKTFRRMTLKNKVDLSKIRLTIDEPEDMIVVNEILKELKDDDFTLNEIMEIIKKKPYILDPNKKIKRNEGYEKSLREDINVDM